MLLILTIFTGLFIIVVEVLTTIFMLTGLSHSKSKFQVISMLTGTGFTTNESEVILLDPRRRRYAQFVILFGYCATVTIVSMIIKTLSKQYNFIQFTGAIAALTIFTILVNNSYIRKKIDPRIQKIGSGIMYGKDKNYLIVLETFHDNIIAKVKLYNIPSELKNNSFEKLQLTVNHGINILAIERSGHKISNISKDHLFEDNDLVILYGEQKKIRKVFNITATEKK